MDYFAVFKHLKNIKPDSAYAATSKRAILATDPVQLPLRGVRALRTAILKIIETGAAVALTGFFILLITGAFSGTGLTPQYSAVNPDALRAEAQAIDIQIELSKLNYTMPQGEPASTLVQAKTAAPSAAQTTTVSSVQVTAQGSPTSTATTTVTIDQVLQGLAK